MGCTSWSSLCGCRRKTKGSVFACCQDMSVDEIGQDVMEESLLDKTIPARIENPNVPFSGVVPVLEVGRAFMIQGKPTINAGRLSVNFLCGGVDSDDIAFHVNPRFDQNYVARNSRLNGRWGEEEDAVPQRSPFKRGEQFNLVILFAEEQFLVAVNGRHFCSYTYRVPLDRINTIRVEGDVTVDLIEHHKIDVYPEPCFLRLQLYNTIPTIKHDADDHTVMEPPYIGLLPHPFHVGNELELSGRVKLLPHSFYMNFQSGPNNWPHPIILLHIKPQFLFYSDSFTGVTMNAWLDGTWGPEENTKHLPFHPGKPFVIKIKYAPDYFIITVDGEHLANFKHRLTSSCIDTICIEGDMFIKHIVMT